MAEGGGREVEGKRLREGRTGFVLVHGREGAARGTPGKVAGRLHAGHLVSLHRLVFSISDILPEEPENGFGCEEAGRAA